MWSGRASITLNTNNKDNRNLKMLLKNLVSIGYSIIYIFEWAPDVLYISPTVVYLYTYIPSIRYVTQCHDATICTCLCLVHQIIVFHSYSYLNWKWAWSIPEISWRNNGQNFIKFLNQISCGIFWYFLWNYLLSTVSE